MIESIFKKELTKVLPIFNMEIDRFRVIFKWAVSKYCHGPYKICNSVVRV